VEGQEKAEMKLGSVSSDASQEIRSRYHARDNRLLAKDSQNCGRRAADPASAYPRFGPPKAERCNRSRPVRSREMKATKILCRKCRVGWVAHERCSQCGYEVSLEEREERMGRLVRNSLILVVSVLAVIWVIHRN
jgi:hypothetical protein